MFAFCPIMNGDPYSVTVSTDLCPHNMRNTLLGLLLLLCYQMHHSGSEWVCGRYAFEAFTHCTDTHAGHIFTGALSLSS